MTDMVELSPLGLRVFASPRPPKVVAWCRIHRASPSFFGPNAEVHVRKSDSLLAITPLKGVRIARGAGAIP